jgi:hypothetical protein
MKKINRDKELYDNLIGDYSLAKDKEEKKFKCSNCQKQFLVQYDENNTPISLWCNECRAYQNKIKQKFKMENSSKNPENKDRPLIALAQMKILLEKSKKYWDKKDRQPAGYGLNISGDILKEIEKILSEANIPEKYLIAESLD